MSGKGRIRGLSQKRPDVLAIVAYCRPKNRRTVTVYLHETKRKMYTFFERKSFYRNGLYNEYLSSLGSDALVIIVEDDTWISDK